jgi:L-idonate 5-dehydrogenase
MKSLQINGKLDMQLIELNPPAPANDEVLIKVAYVGVCGSDLHYYFEGANGAFVVKEPLVPGHELSAVIEVDPLGEFSQGTPITIHPARFGEEITAIADRPHLWPNGSYLGSASTNPHTQGAMSEYMLVKRNMVRVLPTNLDLKLAALAEPLGVALHAINIAGGVKDKSVLVSGSGPIGLLVIAAAKLLGAKSVAASDVLAGPLERAANCGASATYNVREIALPAESFDLVFECAGIAQALSAALKAVRKAGQVVQVGMLKAGEQPIDIAPLVSKEISLLGTFRFNDEIDAAVKMLRDHPALGAVITHTYPLAEAKIGFEMAKNSQESGKVLIEL